VVATDGMSLVVEVAKLALVVAVAEQYAIMVVMTQVVVVVVVMTQIAVVLVVATEVAAMVAISLNWKFQSLPRQTQCPACSIGRDS
jgi:hypothetical protein